jgi:hypothetical protein
MRIQVRQFVDDFQQVNQRVAQPLADLNRPDDAWVSLSVPA